MAAERERRRREMSTGKQKVCVAASTILLHLSTY
jgi:hypothetical protein